jgi:hypothetical protein
MIGQGDFLALQNYFSCGILMIAFLDWFLAIWRLLRWINGKTNFIKERFFQETSI